MTDTLRSAFAAVEGSGLAGVVRDSLFLTAGLSAIHLVGMTLVGSGALMAGLRYSGLLFADEPADAVVRPARRTLAAGLAISIVTGGLLWAPRATAAASNSIFRLKMALLLVAVAWSILVSKPFAAVRTLRRPLGVLNSLLYGAVILAGCAYILLE